MADRGDRGDVDDGAAALPLHHGNDVLHREERALQVDGKHTIPFRLGDLDHVAHLGDPVGDSGVLLDGWVDFRVLPGR